MKRGVPLLTLGAAVVSAWSPRRSIGSVGPSEREASSHREAPLIAHDPSADITDLYAFVSPDAPDTVTIIADYIPFEEPSGGPNFYRVRSDVVLYAIKVDNNGDGIEDVPYQFRFDAAREPEHLPLQHGPIDTRRTTAGT